LLWAWLDGNGEPISGKISRPRKYDIENLALTQVEAIILSGRLVEIGPTDHFILNNSGSFEEFDSDA
jgi:hypothetical protein